MQFTPVPKNKRASIKRNKPSVNVRKYFNKELGSALDIVDLYQISKCADIARDTRATRYDRRRPQ